MMSVRAGTRRNAGRSRWSLWLTVRCGGGRCAENIAGMPRGVTMNSDPWLGDPEDRLRRCTHHTMRIRGEPCGHWECVERNKAADEIERLRAAIHDHKMSVKIDTHPANGPSLFDEVLWKAIEGSDDEQ